MSREVCPRCDGSGKRFYGDSRSEYAMRNSDTVCHICNGTGYVGSSNADPMNWKPTFGSNIGLTNNAPPQKSGSSIGEIIGTILGVIFGIFVLLVIIGALAS